MNPHFERAELLFQQSRHDLAEKELRLSLALDPNFAMAHGLLALCMLERQAFKEATDEAYQTIALAPDLPFSYHVLAAVALARNRLEEAEAAANRAIELNPYDAGMHQLLGGIYMNQRRWPAALQQADEGLKLDADHIGCANLRVMALLKLGRKAEADAVMGGILSRSPEDAFSHANQGWTALNQSQARKALDHFREALRLDPTLDFAKMGMVEALKARFLIYRLMLRWFLFMARLGRQWQWAIVIGLYFGTRFISEAVKDNPQLGFVLWPILGCLIGFAALTWLAYPLFNLMLLLNRYGRHILTSDQKYGARSVGFVLAAALALLAYGLIEDDSLATLFSVICALYTLVLAGLFVVPRGQRRYAMAAAAITIAGIAVYAFTQIYSAVDERQAEGGLNALRVYFAGILIFNIGANILASMREEK